MPTNTINITLNVVGIPGFTLSASPTAQSIQRGQSTSFQISVAAIDGYAGSVSFSATGLPTGATATFAPASVTPGQFTTLTVATLTTTPVGSSTIAVTGTGA